MSIKIRTGLFIENVIEVFIVTETFLKPYVLEECRWLLEANKQRF